MADVDTPKVTYWAVSVLSSRTMWFNLASFALAALSLTEVTTIIPPRFLPLLGMVVALINLYLRTATTRPVAFVAPGNVKAVQVDKVGPPAPPPVTD